MAARANLVLAAAIAAAAAAAAQLALRSEDESGDALPAPHRLSEAPSAGATAAAALWFDTEWGWVVVTHGEDAAPVADDMRAAVAAFYRYFGRLPGRGAVVDAGFASLAPALKQAGAAWVLPWPFRAAGAPGEPGSGSGARSALRHEIGHALFLALVVPNTRGVQYGGDAPDWLDEAAAMLAETPQSIRLRRARFAEAVEDGRVPPLTALIAAPHPLFGDGRLRAALGDPQGAGVPRVVKIDPGGIGVNPERVADFYAASQAIADYLIERSGDERILARVAALSRAGGDPAAWLRTLCDEGALPVAFGGADADFAAWARARGPGQS